MEVRTIGELRNLAIKALGPWQSSTNGYVREGIGKKRVELSNNGGIYWALDIYDSNGHLVVRFEINHRSRISAVHREADKILRKSEFGHIFFDK